MGEGINRNTSVLMSAGYAVSAVGKLSSILGMRVYEGRRDEERRGTEQKKGNRK